MKKISLGIVVSLLSLGTAVLGPGALLANASSGSGHGDIGAGNGQARVIHKVETEVENGVLQVHERREVRNVDGSRVRVDVKREVENGIPTVTVREKTRDAAGIQTDTRTVTPASEAIGVIGENAALLKAAVANEPKVEVKVEKQVKDALGVVNKIEIEKKVEGVNVDAGLLAKIHEMLMQLLAKIHMA